MSLDSVEDRLLELIGPESFVDDDPSLLFRTYLVTNEGYSGERARLIARDVINAEPSFVLGLTEVIRLKLLHDWLSTLPVELSAKVSSTVSRLKRKKELLAIGLARVEDGQSRLNKAQLEFVVNMVDRDYDFSAQVNSVLGSSFDIPSIFDCVQAMFKQLKPYQVDYMMRSDVSPFSFRMQFVTKHNDLSTIERLINHQPHLFGMPGKPQSNLIYLNRADYFFARRRDLRDPSGYSRGGYARKHCRWTFRQSSQDVNQPNDNRYLTYARRVERFKDSLPFGFKGTDRFDWAYDMAGGLRSGTLPDIGFVDGRTDTADTTLKFSTFLEEEGTAYFTDQNNAEFFYSGSFSVKRRCPVIGAGKVNSDLRRIRFRATLSGKI